MTSPYRWLFPVGVAHGLWGAAAWVLFALGWIDYPGPMHSDSMVVGFLFTFSAGFLMTAVPRFTGTHPARRLEIAAFLIPSLGLFAAHFVPAARAVVPGLAAWELGLLGTFFASRYARRTRPFPKPFAFVALGLSAGFIGAILLLLAGAGWIGPERVPAARALLYLDTMVLIAAGVGSQLLPAFFGLRSAGGAGITARALAPAALLLAATPVLDLVGAIQAASWSRALGVSWVAFAVWRLPRLPAAATRLTSMLWISAWSLVAGLWARAAAPAAAVHVVHLAFVSGLGLLTLMIASRVTLSHGGFDPRIERTSRVLPAVGGLLVLGALTRVVAPWMGESYIRHLGYAAAAWLTALVVWGLFFVPKMAGAGSPVPTGGRFGPSKPSR